MIDVEELKKRIKHKFRTRTRFAKIAKIDYYDLQRLLNEKNVDENRLETISKLVDVHENVLFFDEVSDLARRELRLRIKAKGGVRKFCRDNPQFDRSTVYSILSGKTKKMDYTTEELFKFFNL